MAKYQVTVTGIAHEKVILFVKSLRLIADLGLKDAKDLAMYIATTQPCILVAGIDQEVADHVVGLLREAGAQAAVQGSSLTAPLLLCPQANERYRWSWLGGRVPVE
jgi:ribosomal protein L7/L12